jgi:hypothetical protein
MKFFFWGGGANIPENLMIVRQDGITVMLKIYIYKALKTNLT